jgi:hypothetical protein
MKNITKPSRRFDDKFIKEIPLKEHKQTTRVTDAQAARRLSERNLEQSVFIANAIGELAKHLGLQLCSCGCKLPPEKQECEYCGGWWEK